MSGNQACAGGTGTRTRRRRVVRGREVGPKGESRRALACCRGIPDVVGRLFHLVVPAHPASLPISSRSTGSRLVSTGETRMKEPQGSGHTTSLHTRAQTTVTTNGSSDRKKSVGDRGRQQPPVLLGKGRRPPGGRLLGACHGSSTPSTQGRDTPPPLPTPAARHRILS